MLGFAKGVQSNLLTGKKTPALVHQIAAGSGQAMPDRQWFEAGSTSLTNNSSVVRLGNPPQSTMKELTAKSMKGRICSMTCLGVPTKSKFSSGSVL